MKAKLYFTVPFFLTFPAIVSAQTANNTDISTWMESNMILIVSLLVLFVAILTLIVMIYVLGVIRQFVLNPQEEGEAVKVPTLWSEISDKLTGLKPIEQEEDLLLDHNYDGIRELDNHLPPWWKYLFYFTIAFSVVYVAVYHVFDVAPLQIEEYEISMAKAADQLKAMDESSEEVMDENNVEVVTDSESLQNGKAIFDQYCFSCHKIDGGGSIGPNLTDQYWINGGSINDIFRTIKYGVPEKGMIAWERQLTGIDIRDVSSYIVSLEGTNPPDAKEPQGELYDRSAEE